MSFSKAVWLFLSIEWNSTRLGSPTLVTHGHGIVSNVAKTEKISVTSQIYWGIIQKDFPSTTALKLIWEQDLKVQWSDEQWWDLFPQFLAQISPSRPRTLQYRILTRTLTTNVLRNKWDKTISYLCTQCKEQKETVFHLFF